MGAYCKTRNSGCTFFVEHDFIAVIMHFKAHFVRLIDGFMVSILTFMKFSLLKSSLTRVQSTLSHVAN